MQVHRSNIIPFVRALIVFAATLAAPVIADTWYVTTNADSGTGSFRQALVGVISARRGEIVFSNVTGSITLSNPLPKISGQITVVGRGTNEPIFAGNLLLSIAPGAVVRLREFSLGSLQVTNFGSLTVRRSRLGPMEIRNEGAFGLSGCIAVESGSSLAIAGSGKAVVSGMGLRGVDLVGGELDLKDCIVSGRDIVGTNATISCYYDPIEGETRCSPRVLATAARGGGIFAYDSVLTLTRCIVSGNSVHGGNGAAEGAGGNRGITDAAGGLGAGLYVANSFLHMTNCSVVNNIGTGGKGGLSSRNWLVYGELGVGGIYLLNTVAEIVNCTVAKNRGIGGDGGDVGGGFAVGGIYVHACTNVSLINCTITENTASAGVAHYDGFQNPGSPGFGVGGILEGTLYGSVTASAQLKNCILAGNLGSVSPRSGSAILVPNDGAGRIASLGGNLFGTIQPLAFTNYPSFNWRTNYFYRIGLTNADLVDVNPKLGGVRDNGGGMPTYKPLPGSPAIDAAVNPGILFDQRGRPRTCDGRSVNNVNGSDGTDSGAVEVETSMCYQALSVVSNRVQMTFSSESGIEYGLQFKSNLNESEWSILSRTVEGTGGLITLENLDQFQQPAGYLRLFEYSR